MSAPADFGTYRVLHQVGSGVLGPVFRTFDASCDRLIAVKAFKLEIVPEDVARLADALRRLAAHSVVHPSVVPLIDAGLEGTLPFLAMAFVTAETLDVTMRHLGPAPIALALPLIRALAEALEAGWNQGIGHGALHPRDVFVTAGTSNVQVTGHGVVAALERAGLAAPARRSYAAPERIAGLEWDQRADVYSLAAIAHELLTGRRPVAGGEQDGSFAASVPPEVRVALRRVLSTALAESPAERFATAREFVAAISSVTLEGAVAPMPAAPGDQEAAAPATPLPAPSVPLPVVVTPAPEPVSAQSEPALRSTNVSIADDARPESALPAPLITSEIGTRREASGTRQTRSPSATTPAREPGRETKRPVPLSRAEPVEPAHADLRLPLDAPLVPVSLPVVTVRTPYPWPAVIAVAVAGVAVGVVAGYQVGVRRANAVVSVLPDRAAAAQPASSDPTTGDTDVPVAPDLAARTEPGSRPDASPTTEPATPERALPEVRRVRAAMGRLTVRSTPAGALVTVDGRIAGETPVTLADVSLGTHLIQIARPGYTPHGERVALSAAAPARELTVVLRRGLNVAAPGVGVGVGAVVVESTPRGARVTIDGKPAGVTPVRVADLPVGTHVVSIALGGYQSVTARATVAAGQTALVQVTLNR